MRVNTSGKPLVDSPRAGLTIRTTRIYGAHPRAAIISGESYENEVMGSFVISAGGARYVERIFLSNLP